MSGGHCRAHDVRRRLQHLLSHLPDGQTQSLPHPCPGHALVLVSELGSITPELGHQADPCPACREFFGQGWMKVEKNERTPFIMKTTKHFNDVSTTTPPHSTRTQSHMWRPHSLCPRGEDRRAGRTVGTHQSPIALSIVSVVLSIAVSFPRGASWVWGLLSEAGRTWCRGLHCLSPTPPSTMLVMVE